jgi:cell wall-associated NlpC family hydrolase
VATSTESNAGGMGTLLGTSSLQHALDSLSQKVGALTTAFQQGKNSPSYTGSHQASGQASGFTNASQWMARDWNAGSNKSGTANGGGSTPSTRQSNGSSNNGGNNGGGDGETRVGRANANSGGGSGRSWSRAAVAGVGFMAASGVAQMDPRVLMNTTTSMLDRTAVNGSGSRAMFQNNYTSHGIDDTVAAQNTVQSMGFAVGTSGYNTATNYNRTAGLVDPNLSQANAAAASANMQQGNTFNSLRMFGISTIGQGGKPQSPRDLAHQFIVKDFGANKPTTAAGIEASLGMKSRFGQSLNAMVSKGMLDQNTASQVTTMMRAELNAGLKGKSYDQYTSILDKYGSQNSTSAAGTKALASIGLTPTDAAKIQAQAGMKTNQLDANNQAFSTGLGAATTALGQFSNMLTSILSGPAGTALGVSQGGLGGVASTVGHAAGGVASVAGNLAPGAAAMAMSTKVGRATAMSGVTKVVRGAGMAWRGVLGAAGKVGSTIGADAAGAASTVGTDVAGAGTVVGAGVANAGGLFGKLAGAAGWLGEFGGLIGVGLDKKMNNTGSYNGSNWVAPTGGIHGGASTGSGGTPATGSAAKATGTVGAGKTASNVIAIAKKYIGVPYVYGGTSPQQGFDCSGLTQYVFRQVGITLPRTSGAQQIAGKQVAVKDAQPGDLLFTGGSAKSGGADHVVMMVSSSQVIAADHTGTNVRIRGFSSSEFSTAARFLGSMGSMSTDAGTAASGSSGSGTSGSGAPTAGAASSGNALNEMQTLAGSFGSFLSVALGGSKSNGAGSAVAATDTGSGSGSGSGSVSLGAGNSNGQKVFNTLISQGFTREAAAGVIGNLMQESSIDPNSHQGGGGPGRGIMQWTESQRWQDLTKWAGKRNIWALDTQVGFMLKEMNDRGFTAGYKTLKDVGKATQSFETTMEAAGTPNMAARNSYANTALKSYAVGSTNIDVDQNARVHKGELIIPATQAQAVRDALAGNNPISSISGGGGKGVTVTFSKESIKIILGTGATTAMGTQVGRQIVDTIVNDKRLSDIASGVS